MIKFAYLEDNAVRLTDTEAWWNVNGQWKPLNSADANHKASLLKEDTFARMFPDLPDLSAEAFR